MSPGRRSRLFREVNDRICELLESSDPGLPGEFLCECGRECGRRVVLRPAEFAALRDTGHGLRSPDCRGSGLGLCSARSRRAADGFAALG